MNLEDRVGVLQTYNKNGENIGVIVKFSDLDTDIKEMIKGLIEQKIRLVTRCIELTDELRRLQDIVSEEDSELIDKLIGDDDNETKR